MMITLGDDSLRVIGHVDLFDPDERELIELKSTRAVDWQNKKHMLPHEHHVAQIRSYYTIWTRCYDFPAEKLSVAYMDDKTPPRSYAVEPRDLTDWLRQRAIIIHQAIRQDRTPDAEPDGLCHYCAFKESCAAGRRFVFLHSK
jgi:CRISPR/Cas system-associated exonuclease Cas4 (RecB family)